MTCTHDIADCSRVSGSPQPVSLLLHLCTKAGSVRHQHVLHVNFSQAAAARASASASPLLGGALLQGLTLKAGSHMILSVCMLMSLQHARDHGRIVNMLIARRCMWLIGSIRPVKCIVVFRMLNGCLFVKHTNTGHHLDGADAKHRLLPGGAILTAARLKHRMHVAPPWVVTAIMSMSNICCVKQLLSCCTHCTHKP